MTLLVALVLTVLAGAAAQAAWSFASHVGRNPFTSTATGPTAHRLGAGVLLIGVLALAATASFAAVVLVGPSGQMTALQIDAAALLGLLVGVFGVPLLRRVAAR